MDLHLKWSSSEKMVFIGHGPSLQIVFVEWVFIGILFVEVVFVEILFDELIVVEMVFVEVVFIEILFVELIVVEMVSVKNIFVEINFGLLVFTPKTTKSYMAMTMPRSHRTLFGLRYYSIAVNLWNFHQITKWDSPKGRPLIIRPTLGSLPIAKTFHSFISYCNSLHH